MIADDLEYQVACDQARKFEQALAEGPDPTAKLDSRLEQVLRAAMEDQLRELREQLAAYEARRELKGTLASN